MIRNKEKIKVVVIGGSAGSFPIMGNIFAQLPSPFKYPIIVAPHRLKHVRHGFIEALNLKSTLEVVEPLDKEKLVAGKIYIAPANYHMSIEPGNLVSLTTEDMVLSSRPSIDITLSSTGENYQEGTLGILLTGANKDGAYGMKRINDFGGTTIVQDPTTCMVDTMPKAAMAITEIDYVMDIESVIKVLKAINR